ncbi:MAG: ribonuclease HII [Patescibacteria group bacterium]|nr:ribonuclease HII [Patescibacteria group bacterium]
MHATRQKTLIGIDEVGRGPIAGPVAVGVFVLLDPLAIKLFRGVKDSKQLTEEKREEWFAKILDAQAEGAVDFSVTMKSEAVIDKRGLTYAIKTALNASLKALNVRPADCRALLDGGLKAPAEYLDQKTIIRGDEKEKVIALASICAKVTRDRFMRKMAKKYIGYGLETNKGYGTDEHYEAIRTLGLLPIHRRRFLVKK